MIVGITGTVGAGRKTLAKYLEGKGFVVYSLDSIVRQELKDRGISFDKNTFSIVLNDLKSKYGNDYICSKVYDKIRGRNGDFVVEGFSCVNDVNFFRSINEKFVLLGIDADVELRFSRVYDESSLGNETFDFFVSREEKEVNSHDDCRQNLKQCFEMSDYKIKNSWTLQEFYDKIDRIISQVDEKKVVSSDKVSCGILSDTMIKKAVADGKIEIIPFNEKCVQPASYDLHLDNQFKIFRPHRTEVIDTKNPVKDLMEDVDLGDDDFFVLHPGSFALGLIKEKTGVGKKHVGRLEGKSSLARLGLIIHTTAGFLDPGNSLQLTLELFNASPLPIKLYPGMKIAQIAFEELIESCDIPYGENRKSSYFGADKIQESQMHKNFGVYDSETGMYNPE